MVKVGVVVLPVTVVKVVRLSVLAAPSSSKLKLPLLALIVIVAAGVTFTFHACLRGQRTVADRVSDRILAGETIGER